MSDESRPADGLDGDASSVFNILRRQTNVAPAVDRYVVVTQGEHADILDFDREAIGDCILGTLEFVYTATAVNRDNAVGVLEHLYPPGYFDAAAVIVGEALGALSQGNAVVEVPGRLCALTQVG